MRTKDCRGARTGRTFRPRLNDVRTPAAAHCIDLLASPSIGALLGPALARRGPLPVRLIRRIADLSPDAILLSDSQECSVEDCLQLTTDGTEVVILAMLRLSPQEIRYAEAGAAAYLSMTVDDRLIAVLDDLAGEFRVGGRSP